MRAAIVGCGSIARVHVACVNDMEGHELVAFADCKLERAEEFSNQYGGSAYVSLESMLSKECIDILHICTPHYLHTPMALEALNHKVHVFMEKPPVINDKQFELLKKASSMRYLGFCFQNRYNPSIIKVKHMLKHGIPGKILGIRGIVTWNRTENYYSTSDWRGKLALEGGGVLINQSIHTLDLINYLMDQKPLSIDAMMTNHHLKGKIEVEDTMSAYIRYQDAVACFYATSSYIEDSTPIIELSCENMKIRIEEHELSFHYKDGSVEHISMEQKTGIGKSCWGTAHGDCILEFYNAILENHRFPQDLNGMEDTIRLMLGAYESGRSGKEVFFNH
ncbi:MAG TPA: Gfo/Idh/MocA family oxidoreductase [Lachnospiraceae bacterium]|nr:Gfo/Idh/MocA family oxidoreductase [Lachnospiraceae bacterium]